MILKRSWMIFFLAVMAVAAHAQSWMGEYAKGLEAGKKGEWTAARAAFQQAVAYRPEDTDKPTTLPGPVTEQRRWRNGAPYSPNFLAAYAAYRQGMAAKDQERSTSLVQAASEMEMLLDKGQLSREAFYFLNSIYTTLGDTAKRQALEARYSENSAKATFRVDNEIISPEEQSAIGTMAGGAANPAQPNQVKTVPPSNPNPGSTGTQPTKIPSGGSGFNPITPLVGPVAAIPTKYALIIGNGDTKMKDLSLPFAADDAQQLREALTANAGYSEQNIDLVLNATADQIMKSAKALSERVDENATIMIYFSGVGINVGGKDYLAGVDSENPMETGTMVSKAELFRLFLNKGSKVFSFFQVHRPINGGRYFGSEVPMIGQLSQVQGTMPGDSVQAYVHNGKSTGLFTNSMVQVMAEQRSNQLPILEFGWQVFYKMRRGDTGTTGGSSRQTCTLPVLTNLASDARF
jgi:hypothetical protein